MFELHVDNHILCKQKYIKNLNGSAQTVRRQTFSRMSRRVGADRLGPI
jgi:hypothetical protein